MCVVLSISLKNVDLFWIQCSKESYWLERREKVVWSFVFFPGGVRG